MLESLPHTPSSLACDFLAYSGISTVVLWQLHLYMAAKCTLSCTRSFYLQQSMPCMYQAPSRRHAIICHHAAPVLASVARLRGPRTLANCMTLMH